MQVPKLLREDLGGGVKEFTIAEVTFNSWVILQFASKPTCGRQLIFFCFALGVLL